MLATYKKLCTAFYDAQEHANHAPALDFFLRKTAKLGGRILEPMCGSGRFLIPLLTAGLDAEGFDASPAMLDAFAKNYARVSSKKPPVSLQLVQNFTSEKKYHTIFIPYGSWGLIIDRDDVIKGLKRLYDHLEIGGTLLLEIETVASITQQLGIPHRAIRTDSDGSLIALTTTPTYDQKTQIFAADCRYEAMKSTGLPYVAQNERSMERECFRQYLYRYSELDILLRLAGFTKIRKYRAYDDRNEQSMVDNNTPIIIYECVK